MRSWKLTLTLGEFDECELYSIWHSCLDGTRGLEL